MKRGFSLPPGKAKSENHLQLSERVAMHLREEIMLGKFRQGEFLRIEAIANALGYSMTPVREGLLLLQSEALVRLIPRRGFVVNRFSRNDLLDLFWAQATIGQELASRAATRMPDEEIERLTAMQTDYEEAIESGDEALTGRLGHQFHRAINLAAESPRLTALLGTLTRQLPNRFYASIENQLKVASQIHPIILDAIRLRNPQAAGSLMFSHIMDGGNHLVQMLDRRGFWDEAVEDETAGAADEKPAKRAAGKRARS
ncbi:MAG: GntR family transcriptional regulator [Sphingomonas bacterium]